MGRRPDSTGGFYVDDFDCWMIFLFCLDYLTDQPQSEELWVWWGFHSTMFPQMGIVIAMVFTGSLFNTIRSLVSQFHIRQGAD